MLEIIILLLVGTLLSGCNENTPTAAAPPTPPPAHPTAEERAQINQQGKDLWQTTATVTGIGAVSLLFVGSIIGSSARKSIHR